MSTDPENPPVPDRPVPDKVEPYAWYVLGLLMLVYVLNFIDRQMLTILAVDLKRDLHITDSQFGFLYGTAFGVFYALFGIPLGKLADRWSRVSLLASGLAVWSAMTALSGLARNFTQLGIARIGVGVGEASASPAAYSLIADYFPPRRRATALSIYSAGLYLGGGVSLGIGSTIAVGWNRHFAGAVPPFGLAGWQVAFLALGLPGVLLALWVRTLRDPPRGRFEGSAAAVDPAESAWSAALAEMMTVLPPLTLIRAARAGRETLLANLGAAAVVTLAAWLLTRLIGDPVQWISLGIGFYAIFSWGQALRQRDPEAFAAICKARAFVGTALGYGLIAFVSYAASAFGPLYAIERFHADQTQTALLVGGAGAAGGALGIIAGGALADRLAQGGREDRRILVIMLGIVAGMVPNAVMLSTHSVAVFYAMIFPTWFCFSSSLGGASGTIVNLVAPRLRGTATAAFFLGSTLVGLALGPYTTGRLSVAFGSLHDALVAILAVVPVALLMLWMARRDLLRRQSLA